MRRFRFHIGTLVILVLLLAVCFAALRESSDLWDSSIFSITLCVLLISILLAVHRIESKRAFWLAFALFGSGYLGLSLVPSVESRLVTTKTLAYLDSKVPGRSMGPPTGIASMIGLGPVDHQVSNVTFSPGGNQIATVHQAQIRFWNARAKVIGGWSGTTENFIKIGHSLFALLIGWFGGQISRRLCRSFGHPCNREKSTHARRTRLGPARSSKVLMLKRFQMQCSGQPFGD